MNILILGAGLMQKPAILSAKELGYKVCVVDADDKACAIPYADEFSKIDLKDRDGILKYAEELKENGGLAAVFTAGTDFSTSVSYVCEKLNLPSHSFAAAKNASIKTEMRRCFEDSNVPSPHFVKVTGKDTPEISDKGISFEGKFLSYPLVVKPVDNMGARGCRMIRGQNEVKTSLEKALKASRSETAIIEEFMEGEEYSIDALVYNGSFTVTGFAVRHIKYQPYFIEVGHTMPALLNKDVHDQLISIFACGAKALGLTCGAAKADIKFTKNGPMIGEIAGRLSGGYMSGWTYPYSSGLNLTKEAIKIASGKTPDQLEKMRTPMDFNPADTKLSKPYELYEVLSSRTSAERAWISIPGTVEYIEEIKEYTDQAVRDVLPRATVFLGSHVDFPRNNVEKCGNVISVSNNHQLAIDAARDAVSNIFITLKKNNPETDSFLWGESLSDEKDFPPCAYGKLSDSELSEISGLIPENSPLSDSIPPVIIKKFGDILDWNYNTIRQTAAKFDILRKKHPALDARLFWKALLKGGLQAAVYISDSQMESL